MYYDIQRLKGRNISNYEAGYFRWILVIFDLKLKQCLLANTMEAGAPVADSAMVRAFF